MAINEITKILSERLEELTERERDNNYKLSDKQQAKQMGIPSPTFSKYKYNTSECPISAIVKIARYYNVSTDYLLGLTQTKTADELIQAAVNDLGISEKSVKNIKAINQNGGNVDILLEREELNNIVELLNKIKTKTVIEFFDNTRIQQFNEIDKFFSSANEQQLKFIETNYAYSLTKIVCQQVERIDCGKLGSENQVIIWEYCLLQREMRKLLDDIESSKPEYKELFAEYDNSVEEHLKKTLAKKENELLKSNASNNKEIEQNIKDLKQLIDYYHEHIRKGETPNGSHNTKKE